MSMKGLVPTPYVSGTSSNVYGSLGSISTVYGVGSDVVVADSSVSLAVSVPVSVLVD
jgi:hypothetical protein